jgi:hypothetical protein
MRIYQLLRGDRARAYRDVFDLCDQYYWIKRLWKPQVAPVTVIGVALLAKRNLRQRAIQTVAITARYGVAQCRCELSSAT